MKILPISDPHGDLPLVRDIPKEITHPIIVCAGDLCADFIGEKNRVIDLQAEWLDTHFRRYIDELESTYDGECDFITTGGNHDFVFEAGLHRELGLSSSVTILLNRGIQYEGIGRIHGTPNNFCPNGWAFHIASEETMRDHLHYSLPVGPIDLWLCHQPPRGPAALSMDGKGLGSDAVDRAAMREGVRTLITGHIHEGYGVYEAHKSRPYLLVNAALCNIRNERVREWSVLELPETKKERV